MRNVARESFKENQEKQTVLFAQARLLSSLVAATLNLLVIVLLNKLYEYVALWLVNWEQPRTQTEFEHSYTIKMFLFQFINFYLPLIYIALFKVRSDGVSITKILCRVSSSPSPVTWGRRRL